MTKQNKFVPNSNLNFIQLKLFDFSEEKIDHKKKSFQKGLTKAQILKILIKNYF